MVTQVESALLTIFLAGTSSSTSAIKPTQIYDKLNDICKHLVHGRQEDAHEFLRQNQFTVNSDYNKTLYSLSRYLIESLKKSYIISNQIQGYGKDMTPFDNIFGGDMRQEVTCYICKHVSTTYVNFLDLQLDL